MYREHTAYTGFQSICGFRHLNVSLQIKGRDCDIRASVPAYVAGIIWFFVCEIVTGKLNLQNQARGNNFVTYSGPCHTSPTSAGQARGCLTQCIAI